MHCQPKLHLPLHLSPASSPHVHGDCQSSPQAYFLEDLHSPYPSQYLTTLQPLDLVTLKSGMGHKKVVVVVVAVVS
jgi:hypothetical protein